MVQTLIIPTINDNRRDVDTLANLWRQVAQHGFDRDYALDFQYCGFLRQNAVAFLGGFVKLILQRGGEISLLTRTMSTALRTNLEQNGFAYAMGATTGPWRGNSVPYRQDLTTDKNSIIDEYLSAEWLGRGWVNISANLRYAIVGQMWEIYQNAFEHSITSVGVLSCGQHYPQLSELRLSIADFGIGIPANARSINPTINPSESMRWAFMKGTTSKQNSSVSRGLGLDLLKDFIRINRGSLEVISHNGYAKITDNTESYEILNSWFEGTLVNIGLQCDESYYCLSNESDTLSDNYF